MTEPLTDRELSEIQGRATRVLEQEENTITATWLASDVPPLIADLRASRDKVESLKAVLRAKSEVIEEVEAENQHLRDEVTRLREALDEAGGVELCCATHDGMCVDIGTDQECWTGCRLSTDRTAP